jgi:asparagine synthase (glutamine-hydrolysing)
MCGILAWFTPSPPEGREERMAEATRRMAHRGPDGEGLWIEGPVALGHRRLSILDAAGGHQPMERREGRLVLTYNGEIYNFAEIAAELSARGAVFRTRSDTEVILAAYEEWGTDCVHHFIGMFAFALWDAGAERLWVVRDRLGVKPLYYHAGNGSGFACASEIGPLFALGLLRPGLNESALDAYFTLGYVPAPETLFRDIRKLEPGHELIVDRNGIVERVYWDCADAQPEPWSEEE